jgi:hypothetical protein
LCACAGTLALRVLDFATMGNPANAEAFVGAGGLKVLFPAFMGRGVVRTAAGKGGKGPAAKRKRRANAALDLAQAEEAAEARAVSVVATLALQLQVEGKAAGDGLVRLLAKFLEDGAVKVERLVELFVK